MTELWSSTLLDAPAWVGTAGPPVAGRSDGGGAATQGDGGAPIGAPGGGGAGSASPFGGIFPILILLMVFMIVMTMFSGRKEKKRRAEMIASLARHDEVQTVGGVIGKIVEVRSDYVILKIDEATNTKVRLAKSAIQQVLKSSDAPETVEPDTEIVTNTPEKVGA